MREQSARDPYVGLNEHFRRQASGLIPAYYRIGKVLSVNPLRVRAAGMDLDSVERFGGNAIIYDSNFQIISKTYDFVNYIGEDLFLVGTEGKDGLYKVGKGEVIPCKYDRLKELESNTNKDSRLFVSQANKSVVTVGLYDEDGAQVLPAEYTTIESAYDNYIVVGKFKDEKYRSLCGEEVDKFTIVNGIMVVGLGVVDTHNNMLIPPILLAPGGISHSGPGGNRQLWPDENSQS